MFIIYLSFFTINIKLKQKINNNVEIFLCYKTYLQFIYTQKKEWYIPVPPLIFRFIKV